MNHLTRSIRCAGLAMLLSTAAVAHAEVRIGVFGPLTGDAAGYGLSMREAIELAVKEKNAAGGVLGEKIELFVRDDAAKPELAVAVAKRLATSDNVLVMLGSISSPASFASSQVARETGTPQIAINSTAQRITTQGNPWIFRSAVPDAGLSGHLVEFIARHFPDKKRVAFLYVNDDLGKGAFDAFKARADKAGITLVAEEKYTPGDLDFTSQLSRIQTARPDIFIDWSRYSEGALIATQARRKGLNMIRIGSEGSAHPNFAKLAGAAGEGLYYPTQFSLATVSTNQVAKAFAAKVKATYQKDVDYTHALAYDAITAVFLAIEQSGTTTDRAKFRDALKKVAFDSTRGRFGFDDKGDPLLQPQMVRLVDGKEQSEK